MYRSIDFFKKLPMQFNGRKELFAPSYIACSSVSKESACNTGDLDWIPGLGRSPIKGNGNKFSSYAWRTPWTEEPCRVQSIVLQELNMT